ncbi:hypothetical protein [Paenibacillus sp. Soil522]|uniref:hypothetical protein n=1 Tax=Paenibacillus sp. Soil522 TaxID=1736388 RepID=UPI0006F84148|nr:hypothetical protein [Paenibacillus sp. Soil522]KRE45520.1 hypothetical protein ASG81_12980 [Paenibacillus sp. Soil522]
MKKILTVASGLLLSLSISTSVFATEDVFHNYAPQEVTINDQLYIDNIPVLSEKDIKKLDNIQKENSGKEKTTKDDVTVQGWNSWTQTGSSYYYTGHDWHRMNFYGTVPTSVVLETSSFTNASITGSAEYNFATVAQASMSITIGKEWGKKVTYTVVPQKYYSYELKSANKVLQRNYEYTHDGLFSNPIYYASSHDSAGVEQWFWGNPNT